MDSATYQTQSFDTSIEAELFQFSLWRNILGIMKLQREKLDIIYLRQWAKELNLLAELNLALAQAGLLK